MVLATQCQDLGLIFCPRCNAFAAMQILLFVNYQFSLALPSFVTFFLGTQFESWEKVKRVFA
jgi:hypothetical protein